MTTLAIRPTPSTHHRFHLLDALRGVAAMMVVFWHAPVYAKLQSARSTFLAVDFFFCLSGFVIAFSYEKRIREGFTIRRFGVARVIRLYPTYFLGVVAGLVLVLAASNEFTRNTLSFTALSQFLLFQIFMLPALSMTRDAWLFPLDFPAWSIFFELVANLGYVWLVRNRLSSTRHLAILFFGSLLAFAGWIALGGGVDVGARLRPSALMGLTRVTLSFVAGVLAFHLYQHNSTRFWTSVRSTIMAAAIAACLVLLLIAPTRILHTRLFSLFTIAFLFPSLVCAGAFCRLPAALAPICSWLGDISYPVYLLHVHFLRLLQIRSIEHAAMLHPALRGAAVPTVIVLCAAASHIIFRFFDSPVRAVLTRRYNSITALKAVAT